MKKALMIATTGGFLSHFEGSNTDILRDLGYEVIYAANYAYGTYGITQIPQKEGDVRTYQIPVVKEPWRIRENFRAVRWLWHFVKEEEVDLIVCHNPMGGVLGRLAGLFHGGKKPHVLYTAHGFHFYRGAPGRQWLVYGTAERLLARMTDQLVTINREDYEAAQRFALRKDGRVEQIAGVGLDRERFSPKPEIAAAVRRELGVPETAVHIVAASELCANKNLETLIRAIAATQDTRLCATICGEGPDREKLLQLIEACGLQDRVHLAGYRRDMERMLQAADWFAAPSIREGLGMAALEALACGVPLIAANNRGTREYVCDENNGIVCYKNTVEDWQAAFTRVLREPELRDRLARNARTTTGQFGREAAESCMRHIFAYADYCIAKRENEQKERKGRTAAGAEPAAVPYEREQ